MAKPKPKPKPGPNPKPQPDHTIKQQLDEIMELHKRGLHKLDKIEQAIGLMHQKQLEELTNKLDRQTNKLLKSVRENQPTPTVGENDMAQGQGQGRKAGVDKPDFGDWKAKIEKATSAEKSAKELIDGFKTRMQAAVDQALQNGATAEELAPITDELAMLDSQTDELTASVAANIE